MAQPLCDAFLMKLHEQLELTGHLIGLLPKGGINWAPALPGAWSAAELLGHILECLSGFCAVLYTCEPERLAHFKLLREGLVNHRCAPDEALERIRTYWSHIDQGFALLRDADLARRIPTVFVSEGETLMTLLLGNLEHLLNHKHQLFMYLKLMGVAAGTRDLYRFRGEPA
jgi:uncharacterized damage-inducible protein DinB